MRTVRDVLSKKGPDVAAVCRTASVMEAARLMSDRRIGALVVTDGENVVGVFTERDLMNRVVAVQRPADVTQVGDVMTSPCACCRPETTLAECRDVMSAKRIRHLPVVEGGRLCGMVSTGDVLAAEAKNQETTIEYLHQYIYGRT